LATLTFYLVDVVEDLPQGKSLDMLDSEPVLGTDAFITGSNGYEETATPTLWSSRPESRAASA
jgi:malate/lactate dehydrogenase